MALQRVLSNVYLNCEGLHGGIRTHERPKFSVALQAKKKKFMARKGLAERKGGAEMGYINRVARGGVSGKNRPKCGPAHICQNEYIAIIV
jgi:hypothetical protein